MRCGFVDSLGSPSPALFSALTLNSYFLPGSRPVTSPSGNFLALTLGPTIHSLEPGSFETLLE